MRSVELFAGAGGLALGCELAGFKSAAVVEWDRWACDTIRENAQADHPLVRDWTVVEGDVRDVEWNKVLSDDISLVAGGPPCQPFSMGGRARAADDQRDMFPAAAEVIRKLRPKAFILENVRGLTRPAFTNYYTYIQLRLAHPEISAHLNETWAEHYKRLQSEHTAVDSGSLRYNVVPTLVNAANYGVPQQRHRVFLVGYRSDIPAEWAFPDATHSQNALLHSMHVTGTYWERHKVALKDRLPSLDSIRLKTIRRIYEEVPAIKPWRTVRDAFVNLPEPTTSGHEDHLNHVLQLGARSYPGHTGSYIDAPAKTLKAGDHGVPGGENMIRRVDESIRYFSIRESARLQTFPDRYELHGSWTEAMRQLGNAVPVRLAQVVAGSVHEHLALADARIIGAAQQRRALRLVSA